MPFDWLQALTSESGTGNKINLGGRQRPSDMAHPALKGMRKPLKGLDPFAPEQTFLSPLQEALFHQWLQKNQDVQGVRGWDQPDSRYDIRGFFANKDALAGWKPGEHGTDLYKQHGHPTFSVESIYSRGLQDGGQWIPGSPDERGLIQPPMPAHKTRK